MENNLFFEEDVKMIDTSSQIKIQDPNRKDQNIIHNVIKYLIVKRP